MQIVILVLLVKEIVPPRDIPFEQLFFTDLLMIIILTTCIVKLRTIELDYLIHIGIFKNVDDMSDREMFNEYDKMRKQSYLMKKKYKSGSFDSFNDAMKNRVSINDN